MSFYVKDLERREDIILKKEAMLAEKSELEMKKLRSSQLLTKVIIEILCLGLLRGASLKVPACSDRQTTLRDGFDPVLIDRVLFSGYHDCVNKIGIHGSTNRRKVEGDRGHTTRGTGQNARGIEVSAARKGKAAEKKTSAGRENERRRRPVSTGAEKVS